MQQGEGVAPPGPLPTLPRNARFVRHPNKCFDWGTWGWALDSQVANLGCYEYFIFLNPSVRPQACLVVTSRAASASTAYNRACLEIGHAWVDLASHADAVAYWRSL